MLCSSDCAYCSWTEESAVQKQVVLEVFEVLGEWLDKNHTRPWTTGFTVEKDRKCLEVSN